MYLRQSRQKRADSSSLVDLQLAGKTWDAERKRSRVRIVHHFGRADDPTVTESLRRLAMSTLRRCAPEEMVAAEPSWKLIEAWPYGPVCVLE